MSDTDSEKYKRITELFEIQREVISCFSNKPFYIQKLMDMGLIDENKRVICTGLNEIANKLHDDYNITVTKEILRQFNQPYSEKSIETAVAYAKYK